MPYATPGPDLTPVVEAPPAPMVFLAPGGAHLALLHYELHPPVALLARPYLALAGIRVDPRLAARRRVRRMRGLSVLRVSDGREQHLPLPGGAAVSAPAWSPDGRRLAVMIDREDGVGVWVADAEAGTAAEVPALTVRDVLGGDPSPDGGTIRWSRDGRSLLVLAAPAEPPARPAPVIEPRIEEAAGQRSQLATFTDLLATPAAEDEFEALATTVPCRVSPESGEVTVLGPPGLYYGLAESPDARFLLVHRLRRPFSFRVPWYWFSREVQVRDAAGTPVRVIASLPVSDEVPRQGVPTGPRLVSWQERAGASLLWTQALDGGDPVAPAGHRDRVFELAAPFAGEPAAVLDLRHRCLGWYQLDAARQLLVTEHDRDRRWLTTWWCDLDQPERRSAVFDLPADDAYHHPGTPLMGTHPDGTRTVLGEGSAIYLRGDGASPGGDRPFFDRFDLATLRATRLHESPPGCVEHVAGFSGGREQVVIWHESPAEPPNLLLAELAGPGRRWLTSWPDPHPALTGISKRLLTHDRGDGVTLSGMLYLPPGHDPATGPRLPLLIWAYPYDFGSADLAGQVRAGSAEFTRVTALGPVPFVLRGFAVLADAAIPVIGDPETMNDTYLEQISAAAAAHIGALAKAGIIDPARVAVGGHSYGAFMTANLLAHTGLFAAGIARSGAYNRTLTPFGFQTERRSFWEAPGVYDQVSPFRHADKITAPLLLIHGAADANSGTYPIQSERMFAAIRGTGGTARLVVLPHENHVYLARESVLHVLAEQLAWLERWLCAPAGKDAAGDGGAGKDAAGEGAAAAAGTAVATASE